MSRRTLLQAFGASVALPALDRMTALVGSGVAHAAPSLSAHTRVAYLFFPNGCPRQLWEPAKLGDGGTLATLGPVMQALAPLREHLTVIDNVWTPTGMGHINGTATWMTGEHYRSSATARGAVSADQLLAGLFAPTYRVPALTLALDPLDPAEKAPARCSISWRRPRGALPAVSARCRRSLARPVALQTHRRDHKVGRRRGKLVRRLHKAGDV